MDSHSSKPNPNKRPLTGPDPDFGWDYRTNLKDPPPPRPIPKVQTFEEWIQAKYWPKVEHVQQPNPNKRPYLPPPRPIPKVPKFEEWGQAKDRPKVEHVQQPNPNKRPLTGPDPDFDPPPLRPAKVPKLDESGQATGTEHPVEHVQQPNPNNRPSTGPDPDFDGKYHPQAGAVPLSVPVEYLPSTSAGLPVFHAPPPSPESVDPELPSLADHQSLSTDSNSEPVDLLAAIYAAKGKAKVSRRISGTTRDVGNAARR
jgi:hypothetical protein